MSLIIRIDVDRPYGKKPFIRRLMSRVSSDLYFTKVERFGYLKDLKIILGLLNSHYARSYLFYRKCTLPNKKIIKVIEEGRHVIGLHLENSHNFDTFFREFSGFQKLFDQKIYCFSKHGSGRFKYGLHHYAPYEPEKYISCGKKVGMKIFFGNKEDPALDSYFNDSLYIIPSFFSLEPHWRNTNKYKLDWLINESGKRDVVLLFHPDNIISDKGLFIDLVYILENTSTKIF